ncbi:MAG: outer membrane lipoprotein carrier protein LolA [Flavobacteriaceae bacterium]|nr:outer membrane lipoprotein carrier protein LolA [Flavobacteriaceae bacterium]
MKKIIFTIFIVLTSLASFSQNGGEAKKLLDEVSQKMSSYQNIFIDFDYVLDNKEEDVRQELSGDVLLQGEKYKVNLFGSTQIFDGNKTYTIIPENEEVNVSNADIDDENMVTPSKFYSFYKSGYSFYMDKKKKIKGKKIQFVKLVPMDSNSEVNSVLVGVDLSSMHIYQVIENGKNGTNTILTAKKIKTNQDLASNLFTFDKSKFEKMGYFIND